MTDSNNTESKFRIAYTIGITKDGQLFWEVTGNDQGVVELLGLHNLAGQQVKNIVDSKLGVGDAITHQVLKLMEEFLSKKQTKKSKGQ